VEVWQDWGVRNVIGVVALALLAAACGSADGTAVTVTPGSVPAGSSAEEAAAPAATSAATASTSANSVGDGCADVVGVEVSGDGPYRFAVTVSSQDTGWDKYADEWRIESEAGEILGLRELAHPHVDEQPFTRSLDGVDIDTGTTVIIAARDSVEGYCGSTVSVMVGA
jgi:hypothetical protein